MKNEKGNSHGGHNYDLIQNKNEWEGKKGMDTPGSSVIYFLFQYYYPILLYIFIYDKIYKNSNFFYFFISLFIFKISKLS